MNNGRWTMDKRVHSPWLKVHGLLMLGKGLASLIPKKNSQQPPQEEDFTAAKVAGKQPQISEQLENLTGAPDEGKQKGKSFLETSRSFETRKPAGGKNFQEAIFQIEIDKIKSNPHQPRRDFNQESLKELAASIQEFGILQPLIVSKKEKEVDGGTQVEYQLVAGERRLLAAKMLGWERVPVIIRNIDKKSEQLELAVIENLQRADLNPVETARAYAKLQDEFNLTQREIATRLGKSRETIANTLRLLNLPSEIQDALAKNQINESQARLLLIIDDPSQQQNLFKEIINNNLSVRELRQRVKKSDQRQTTNDQRQSAIDPEIINLQEKLSELLGAEVKIQKTGEAGKIVITFYSPEEIQGIIEKLS